LLTFPSPSTQKFNAPLAIRHHYTHHHTSKQKAARKEKIFSKRQKRKSFHRDRKGKNRPVFELLEKVEAKSD
jgi:hypothetical protein